MGEDGEARGHMGTIYFDSEKCRKRSGIAAEAIWRGLTEDVLELSSKGWIILIDDFNAWLGAERWRNG
jgi:hypothetical protein